MKTNKVVSIFPVLTERLTTSTDTHRHKDSCSCNRPVLPDTLRSHPATPCQSSPGSCALALRLFLLGLVDGAVDHKTHEGVWVCEHNLCVLPLVMATLAKRKAFAAAVAAGLVSNGHQP